MNTFLVSFDDKEEQDLFVFVALAVFHGARKKR